MRTPLVPCKVTVLSEGSVAVTQFYLPVHPTSWGFYTLMSTHWGPRLHFQKTQINIKIKAKVMYKLRLQDALHLCHCSVCTANSQFFIRVKWSRAHMRDPCFVPLPQSWDPQAQQPTVIIISCSWVCDICPLVDPVIVPIASLHRCYWVCIRACTVILDLHMGLIGRSES